MSKVFFSSLHEKTKSNNYSSSKFIRNNRKTQLKVENNEKDKSFDVFVVIVVVFFFFPLLFCFCSVICSSNDFNCLFIEDGAFWQNIIMMTSIIIEEDTIKPNIGSMDQQHLLELIGWSFVIEDKI